MAIEGQPMTQTNNIGTQPSVQDILDREQVHVHEQTNAAEEAAQAFEEEQTMRDRIQENCDDQTVGTEAPALRVQRILTRLDTLSGRIEGSEIPAPLKAGLQSLFGVARTKAGSERMISRNQSAEFDRVEYLLGYLIDSRAFLSNHTIECSRLFGALYTLLAPKEVKDVLTFEDYRQKQQAKTLNWVLAGSLTFLGSVYLFKYLNRRRKKQVVIDVDPIDNDVMIPAPEGLNIHTEAA